MQTPNITALHVSNFRNIKSAVLNTPLINIISGTNGSGKSSLLEALYYLSHFKSFRTSKPQHLIHHDHDAFCLRTTVKTAPKLLTIGVQRATNHEQQIRLDNQTEKSSTIAQILPMQFIDTHCHQFFTEGPSSRRQYLNWGLFHMKQSFIHAWKQFNLVIKQRNAALRNRQLDIIESWDHQLIPICEEIHQLRQEYVDLVKPTLIKLLGEVLGTEYPQVEMRYSPGWDTNKLLLTLMQERRFKDLELGYTQLGPHRADFQLIINNKNAKEYLSQGQMKLAAYSLKIAQSIAQKENTGKSTIFLVDDLQAELDKKKQSCIVNQISELKSQCFYTALDPDELLKLQNNSACVSQFHVKQGKLMNTDSYTEKLVVT